MCAQDGKSNLVGGILKMKCPNCRIGKTFVNDSVFPLSKTLKLVDYCEQCGQKMTSETNNGPGINYALTVIIFLFNLMWYIPIFGINYMDDSIYYYMATSTVIVILLQPWSMRYSRILYLYMYVPYQSNRYVKK